MDVNDSVREGAGWLSRLAGPSGGYVWMVVLALWGGTASYLGRLKSSQGMTFSLAEWIGELAISGFAGLLMAYLCTEMQMSWYITAVATGITGHMGGRGLFMMEQAMRRRFGLGEKDTQA